MQTEIVQSVTLAGAAAAGLISFASPCVLPIVPGFLSVITGLDFTSADAREGRSLRIARDTGLFVDGFSAVFILLGLTATTGHTTVEGSDRPVGRHIRLQSLRM